MGLLLIFLFCIIVCVYYNQQYKKETYYQITKNTLLSTLFDTGRNGEYQIYRKLRGYEKMGGKFLFNCYLPKDNGETTEIDVLLIQSDGIYVFESKNYSGWIFGDEKSKQWTQTLPQGKGRSHKEHFFNPIMQNKVHIKWLQSIVGDNVPLYSIIVFSERCTLKNLNIESKDVQVIKRTMINHTVEQLHCLQSNVLNEPTIDQIYEKLYPFTQMSEEQKNQHIQNITTKYNAQQKKVEQTYVINQHSPSTNINTDTKICPKCGAKLVLRTAKKGANAGQQFFGCSNYPKCRYIIK